MIYSARSHYGEEKPFEDFAKETGTDLTLCAAATPPSCTSGSRPRATTRRADVLITVDAANLWRAKQAGLLEPVKIGDAVPDLSDPDGTGTASRCGRGRSCARPSA